MFLEEKETVASIIQTARVQKDGHSRNWPTVWDAKFRQLIK
jgi:hypothetical protein